MLDINKLFNVLYQHLNVNGQNATNNISFNASQMKVGFFSPSMKIKQRYSLNILHMNISFLRLTVAIFFLRLLICIQSSSQASIGFVCSSNLPFVSFSLFSLLNTGCKHNLGYVFIFLFLCIATIVLHKYNRSGPFSVQSYVIIY